MWITNGYNRINYSNYLKIRLMQLMVSLKVETNQVEKNFKIKKNSIKISGGIIMLYIKSTFFEANFGPFFLK